MIEITAIAAVMVIGAVAHGEPAPPDRAVTVCLEGYGGVLGIQQAQMLASKMFGRIGVIIKWQIGLRGCPERGILVSLGGGAFPSPKPGTLAYAIPYKGSHVPGSHIRLLYDRITQLPSHDCVPFLLAHVLVHEITHVLQGIDRHSDHGVMKAHWDELEIAGMIRKPLEFEQLDIDLISHGITARAVTLREPDRRPRFCIGPAPCPPQQLK